MDRMIIVIFDYEPSAYAAFHAMKELHEKGSISLFAGVVVNKEMNGQLKAKPVSTSAQLPPMLSIATDALVRALRRAETRQSHALPPSPIMFADVGVSDKFIGEISRHLKPGKSAVIAEAEEDWVTPLDRIIDLLGGVVLRRARAEFIDAQLEREASVLRAEADLLRCELSRVDGTTRAKLQARADAAVSEFEVTRTAAQACSQALALEAEAKIRWMRAQVANATGDERANVERRIFDVENDYRMRLGRIGRAWHLLDGIVPRNCELGAK
jgi:uncharacterized membrane protein